MKKKRPPQIRPLDKALVEAGLQCKKRLWIDCHHPKDVALTASRQSMAELGKQLLSLAQSVFPKGVTIEGDPVAEAVEATRRHIEAETPVLFGATFEADGVVVGSDILVRHKDGAIDLYEVKSGTKIAQRYLNDLALQTHVLEACGLRLRAAFLLHQNPKYEHKEGADYPPMQLLRSADVTAKVKKQVTHLATRLTAFRNQIAATEMPDIQMGRFCMRPGPCPHVADCSKTAPEHPTFELPELTREQEAALRSEGIFELTEVDPQRPGLSFVQRRTIESLIQGKPIIEPFVRDELRQCAFPVHFVSIASLTDALPRFEGQRPWRSTPYAWAVRTLHEEGRLESASFSHVERSDPRGDVVGALAKHLEIGGTIVCWNAEPIEALRALLEDLPSAKVAARAVIGRTLVDMRQLFEAGLFHPDLRGHGDFAATVAALLGDAGGKKHPIPDDENSLRELLEKSWAPRVRSTTREKIAAQIEESLGWRCERMLQLFRQFGEVEAKAPASKQTTAGKAAPRRKLPES